MEDYAELLINFDGGYVESQSLVDWAISELEKGNDSIALNELAWQTFPGRQEGRELFIKSLEELNYKLPSLLEMQVALAKIIAKKMVRGEKDINDGCSEIDEISRDLNSPDSLSIFELLSHEQYSHENIGITAENIKPSIIEAATELINET